MPKNNFPFELKQLPGGLSAVLLPRKETKTVTFMVLIGVGSRYETPRQSGLSHFLEHMFFKGTETRPTTKEISEAIDAVGGEFNAFTGEEYTGYYVKVAAEHLQRGADVVSDILLRPLFASEEIERERGVITEEIRMYTDLPMRHVWHLWNKAIYGDHPLGRRIDGTAETVAAFKQKDFKAYTKQHYHTGNAVVAVAGQFNPVSTEKLLTQLFAPLSKGAATKPKVAPRRTPASRYAHEYRKSLDQTHIIFGTPGISLADEDRWAADLLSVILGGGMSSRLFLSIRERHGLVYAVATHSENLTDAGAFATQAGVRTDSAAKAVELIREEYDRIMEEKVSPEELDKAKQIVRGRMLIELEETNALAIFAGAQKILLDRVQTPDEVLGQIGAVTADDIQRIARRILAPQNRVLVTLGPQKSTRPFTKAAGL